MIEVQNLTKIYNIKKKGKHGNKIALHNLNFIAQPGKITGLIGENGAGKSTTMRILATLIQPTSGLVKINQMNINDTPKEIRKQISVLFGGEPVLYNQLTARENILYFAQLNGLSNDEANKRIDSYTERFKMQAYIDQQTKEFSRGMKQKTAIVRSLIHEPSVIIFDEPTTGLDISAARIIYDVLEDLRTQNKTILLSSHSMYEVNRLCDNVIILHEGKKIEEGIVDELLVKYQEKRFEDLFIRLIENGGTHDEKTK